MRGYWKFNNSLLDDDLFNISVKQLVKDTFNDGANSDYKNKWEYFKYKIRLLAIERSKELKKREE